MVRSKEVPKKPKDPLLTPPSKPRGFSFRDDGGFGGSLPRNRGGAAMSSPAPASVPNYMRATNSSGAKSGQRQRAGAPSSASASPARQRMPARVLTKGKVLFPEPAATASPGMVRPTCSSTLKEAKFPSALDLAPGATDAEGPAAMRVCPYNYCSLNGHTHSPAVPLRSFLAKRRRLIKTQQNMKHKGVSAFRKGTGHQTPEDKIVCAGGVAKAAPPLVDEEALGDFFVEVYTGPRVSSGTSCSDMSLDEVDATVRRMEFVVFDRCGADDDDEKGNDLGVSGDGEGSPEDRPGVCRDSSSECSDAGMSGNVVEELPWMRYQGYECDSLDDDVSEEPGQIREEIGGAEVLAQVQESKDEEGTSGGLGDEREEEADEQQKPEDEEIISDLPREGIIAEEEGFGCRVDQQEASAGQETQHPGDDEECVSDVPYKMEISAEQTCIVSTVKVCKELEDKGEDNILDKVCQGDTSDGQSTSEEKVSDGVCESEIAKYEVAERVENVTEDSSKEENSADHEAKDDETSMDSVGKFEIAEKQMDGESEIEISETVPDVACKDDFFEQEEANSRAVSEGEISNSGAIGSQSDESAHVSNGAQIEVCVDDPAQTEPEITERKPEESSEEYGIPQESSQSDESAHVNNGAEAEPELTACKSEDPFEESGFAHEIVHDDDSECLGEGAQMQLGNVTGDLEEASEESGIAQGIGEDDNSAYDAQMQLGNVTNDMEDTSEESGTAQRIGEDVNSAYDAQMQLGNVTSDMEETSEESGTAQKIGEDDNSSFDAQNDSEITRCKLADQDSSHADLSGGAQNASEHTPSELANASETSDATQEAVSDDHTADVSDDTQKNSEIMACESEHAHEEVDVITQEGNEDDYTASALKETQITTCETKDASEEVCITEEANLLSIVQIPEQSCNLSDTGDHGVLQNLPAEENNAEEFSVDDMCNVFSGMNLKGDVYVDPTESEISPRKRLIIAGRRRTAEEEEYMRGFNPRAPNFLPLELDPDSEKVDLKHQTAEDRKNAEEWMIDYALRRAVNNLGGRKKKVELLVQAFETVLPHEEDDKKNITPTRPAQACN